MATLTCSLNITIPSGMIIFWRYDLSGVTTPRAVATTTGNTATLVINDLQQSDAGDYQCVFSDDPTASGWTLRRNIRLLITGMFATYYRYGAALMQHCERLQVHDVTFYH